MKLTDPQITKIEEQTQALPIPNDHPIIKQLTQIFGDHTFYLSNEGLICWESVDDQQVEGDKAVAVQIASWTDEEKNGLEPHEPQVIEVMVDLAPAANAE